MSNTHLTLKEFHDRHLKLGNNDVILDVRNPDEFKDSHIKGALNYPVSEVVHHVEELKKYDHIYIHCKRGGRAQTAFQILSGSGLTNLVCISDAGMDMWISEIRLPLLIAMLFFVFQMPVVQMLIFRKFAFLSMIDNDGQPNLQALLLRSILFGGAFYIITRTIGLTAIIGSQFATQTK